MFQKITALCLITFAIACSKPSSNQEEGKDGYKGPLTAQDLGYDPNQRWPQKGDYSYTLSETINGVECKLNKKFSNLSSYCVSLQDESLNSCGLQARKRLYTFDCGSDFQEFNFKSKFFKVGFDERLQRRCSTHDSGDKVFSNMNQYCQYLSDESVHGSCFWDDRHDSFQDLNCKGEFSVAPILQPKPEDPEIPSNPPTQPEPPRDPLDQIAAVVELRKNGIEVDMNWDAYYRHITFPGEPSKDILLKDFWNSLDLHKNEIIARKKIIKKLHISVYVTYNAHNDFTGASKEELTLDFTANSNQLQSYFGYLDSLVKLSKDLNIEFDFIHNDSNGFGPIVSILNIIEKNYQGIESVKHSIKKIEFKTFSSYYLNKQELTLNENKIEQELLRFIKLLQPLNSFFSWLDNQKIGFEESVSSDFEKDYEKIKRAFIFLKKNIGNFSTIKSAKFIDEIELSLYGQEVYYWETDKNLRIGFDEKNEIQTQLIINSFANQAKMAIDFGKPIKISSSELDSSYVKAISILEKVYPKIKSKTSSISQIEIGYRSNYSTSRKELTIGKESSLSETEKVIDSIR